MVMKLYLPAVLSVVLSSACAPSFEQMAAQGMGDDWGQTSPTGVDEDEANMAALLELMARAESDDAPMVMIADGSLNTPIVPEGVPVLPLVVTAPESALTESGELKRSFVLSFLQRGPHALLAAVELVPGRIDGRLLGLQVQSIRESGEFLTEAGISPGDIILSVNGEEVLFPDQFMQIWEAVPGADTLTVRLLRDGNTQTLEWTIFDDSEVAVNAD
jgi:hypothetical protein